ncbi:hypothetical protein FJZ18_00160 [Candidatus Pacearchaeota archaeon]|nr:hypothetical protein [Candidatus Pacearchaeota archaeon]
MAPEGEIFGTDSRGNYKVRTPRQKTVVLTGSVMGRFKIGDRVNYKVTSYGEHVNFSTDYGLADAPKPEGSFQRSSAASRLDNVGVEIVLCDTYTNDVLLVGNWDNPFFVAHTEKGKICGRDYVLTHTASIGATIINEESLARRFGVDERKVLVEVFPSCIGRSALQYVFSVPHHEDRQLLERAIQRLK